MRILGFGDFFAGHFRRWLLADSTLVALKYAFVIDSAPVDTGMIRLEAFVLLVITRKFSIIHPLTIGTAVRGSSELHDELVKPPWYQLAMREKQREIPTECWK